MKRMIIPCLLCVIFCFALSVNPTFCFTSETLKFTYNNKVFNYSLSHNIKSSSQFDLNFEINRLNRFKSKTDRKNLLKKLLDLGFDKDITLDYLFPNLSRKINSIAKNIYVSMKDSEMIINSNSEKVFHISNEVVGIEIDKPQLLNDICSAYLENKELSFVIPIKKNYPQIIKKDFENFTNLRAEFSTNISLSTPDRKHNIKNALNSLNKIEIQPNQIFSFNKIIGKRTAENGYRNAKIIINNEFVDGVGGGVCQVSSTLYNCALLAGLDIIEANKHSKSVSYVKQGFDAMVNFGSSDLKFKNNTNEKLIIITNHTNDNIKIRIFGKKMNNVSYKLRNEVFNIVEPKEEIIIDEKKEYLDKVKYLDESFYLKKGSVGMEIKTYREKYENNILISTELLRHDKFKVQNSIKVFGAIERPETLIEYQYP